MKLVIGGTVSIILGILGITGFFSDFVKIIQGIIPVVLIVGGVLVIMLKREEDSYDTQDMAEETSSPVETEPVQTAPITNLEPEPEPQPDAAAEQNPAPEPQPEPEIEAPPETEAVEESQIEGQKDNPPDLEPIKGDGAFVGNEGSLVFHKLSCKYSKSKKCTVYFDTRDAAIEQGYKPCNICKP